MNTRSLFKKVVAITAAVSIATTTFGMSAFAETKTSETTLTGAQQVVGGDITFNPIHGEIKGYKTDSAVTNWSISNIVDATGTGSGWQLSMNLGQFKEVDGLGNFVTGGEVLPTNSLSVVTAPTVTADTTTGTPAEEAQNISTVKVDAKLDSGSSIQIITAPQGSGMGTFNVNELSVKLSIPANAYAKTYKSEAIVSLENVPQ